MVKGSLRASKSRIFNPPSSPTAGRIERRVGCTETTQDKGTWKRCLRWVARTLWNDESILLLSNLVAILLCRLQVGVNVRDLRVVGVSYLIGCILGPGKGVWLNENLPVPSMRMGTPSRPANPIQLAGTI